MLACCISAFVTVNRFGFALEGSWCAMERIYYDSINGQLQLTKPKWEGFSNISSILSEFLSFFNAINDNGDQSTHKILIPSDKWKKIPEEGVNNFYQSDGYIFTLFETEIGNKGDVKDEINKAVLPYTNRYSKIVFSLYQLEKIKAKAIQKIEEIKNYFDKKNLDPYKSEFMGKFRGYAKTLRGGFKILPMIYYCLLLIAVTFAGVSMMFYACLKRQGYLITFMHVLWNIIRFFIFSFFLYGTAFGIGFLVIKDAISSIMYIFGENLKNEGKLLPDGYGKQFFEFCLLNDENNFKKKIDEDFEITTLLNDFFSFYQELNNSIINLGEQIVIPNSDKAPDMIKDMKDNIKNAIISPCLQSSNVYCVDLGKRSIQEGGIFGAFDCGFLKSDLANFYRALYHASVESRILCTLSLCISFFGAVALYFFLLVLHHYNNELFFDSGKSVFKGFEGFGAGYKKKNYQQDPAYKKRRLRNEIELTSKNDEGSEYKNVNKNEEDEE